MTEKNIYEISKCSYCCEEENVITRPTPFLADEGMMCKYCWDNTQEEYKNSTSEYIPDFESGPGFADTKVKWIQKEVEFIRNLLKSKDRDIVKEAIAEYLLDDHLERTSKE